MSTLPAPRQAAGLQKAQLWVRGRSGCRSARSNSTQLGKEVSGSRGRVRSRAVQQNSL